MTCAHAVRGALKKMDGVESVEVSLNKGLAEMRLKAGNTVRLEEVWSVVRESGFTPKETNVTLKGEVITTGGNLKVKPSGLSEVYDLAPEPERAQAHEGLKKRPGETLILTGAATPTAKGETVSIRVKSFRGVAENQP
ncbi:MAG: heavy-metal-associated domain-containing protein [Bryobacteraceae bacterium]